MKISQNFYQNVFDVLQRNYMDRCDISLSLKNWIWLTISRNHLRLKFFGKDWGVDSEKLLIVIAGTKLLDYK